MNDLEAFYVLGFAVGPYPYPTIVHNSKVISEESRRQILEKRRTSTRLHPLPVGGGSNAIGEAAHEKRTKTRCA